MRDDPGKPAHWLPWLIVWCVRLGLVAAAVLVDSAPAVRLLVFDVALRLVLSLALFGAGRTASPGPRCSPLRRRVRAVMHGAGIVALIASDHMVIAALWLVSALVHGAHMARFDEQGRWSGAGADPAADVRPRDG